MGKNGYSRQGFSGDIHHYDERGRKTGTSRRSLFGGYTNYDAKGKKTGHSAPGLVKVFGHNKYFKKLCKNILDKLVAALNKKGVKNTAYIDKEW